MTKELSITVEELIQRRKDLEDQIADLLRNFSKETGVGVDEIILTTTDIMCGKKLVGVKVEIDI